MSKWKDTHGTEEDYFKWFLACLLFGKPIQQEVAKRTYFEFLNAGLTTTATKLLDICKALKETYGSLTNLLQQAQTIDELTARLQEFKGIGAKTADIFLRDMTHIFLEYYH